MGWQTLNQGVDALVAKTGAKAVAVEGRDEVSALSYYRRDDAQPVFIWRADTVPANQFELTQALHAGAPEPLLLLADCSGSGRVAQGFADVSDLGPVAAATGPTSARIYHAFLVSGARDPIPPIGPCS